MLQFYINKKDLKSRTVAHPQTALGMQDVRSLI